MHSICYVVHEGLTYEDAVTDEDLLVTDDDTMQEWLQKGHGDFTYREDFEILRLQDIDSQNIEAFICLTEDGQVDLEKDAITEVSSVMANWLVELGEEPKKIWTEYVKRTLSGYSPDTAVTLATYRL